MGKPVDPNSIFPLAVRQHRLVFHTIIYYSMHYIPIQNLFPEVLVSA